MADREPEGDDEGDRDCDADSVGAGELPFGVDGGDEFGRRVMVVIAPPATMTGMITMRIRRARRSRT
ncbi:hypothetical protein [Streptomyces sp. T028]|uniref:hypothetical protein n=1 Tax=Streptomyces sp. T028 TaxID=3394379 RepID=UPI003A84793E